MRDIFGEIFDNRPPDPMDAARRSMRPVLRKRFYERAAVGEGGPEGFPVLLDGRPVRTPARRLLAAPVRALARALADEWQAQGEAVDPAAMPLTRLANAILDGVADQPAQVAAEIATYLGADLLYYRAEGPEGLLALQAAHWDPLIAWARETLGARFVLAQGVMFVEQPAAALAAARTAIPADPWALGALHSATTLTGSPLIALALAAGRLDAERAWQAANVDEDWTMQTWGRDELALERRSLRFREMQAAATVLEALRG